MFKHIKFPPVLCTVALQLVLGVSLACAFGIINAMWPEVTCDFDEDTEKEGDSPSL